MAGAQGGAGAGQGGAGTPGGTGDGGGDGNGDGSTIEESTIAAPTATGTDGERIVVPGQSGEGPSETTGRANGATRTGAARVTVREALPSYRVEAGRALSRLQLSPSVRSVVRSYFDSLGETP